jgi:hypothetical protein
MSKRALKKSKRRSKAIPVLVAAGLSLSLASGASASTGGQVADVTPQTSTPNHEIFLGEEEISDVSRRSMSSTRKMPHNRSSARKLPGAADVVGVAGAAGDAAGAAAAAGAAEAVAGPGAAVAGVRPNCRTGSFYRVFPQGFHLQSDSPDDAVFVQ